MAIINFWPNYKYDFTDITYIFSAMLPINKSRTKAILRIGPHNKETLDIIVCGMLGDFWADTIPGKTLNSTRIQLEQSIINSAYIHYLTLYFYNLGYCARPVPVLVTKTNKNTTSGFKEKSFNYRLTLFTFTSLNWIFDSFYTKADGNPKKKRVPFFISEYLTPIGLAHLVMQIGSKIDDNLLLKTKFNSVSLDSPADLNILKNSLFIKYNIDSQIILNKDGDLNLLINYTSFFKLSKIIKPYIPNEFLYLIISESESDLNLVTINDNTNLNNIPKLYLNADTSKIFIIKENKNKSGIYRWTHKDSGKSYIGSSKNLSVRFKNYYKYSYIADPMRNMLINKALLKYGYSAFTLEILEYCDNQNLIAREQYYLDLFKPEYNILKIAGSSLGFKHSSLTLQKLRSRTKTAEELKKLKVHLLKLNSTQFTKSFKKRLSEATSNFNRLTKSKKLIISDMETGSLWGDVEFYSWREAALNFKISRNTIKKYIDTCNLFKSKYKISSK